MPSPYRQPRKPTQYQAQFAHEWGRIWATVAAVVVVAVLLGVPHFLFPHGGAGFWIAGVIWWGIMLLIGVALLRAYYDRRRPGTGNSDTSEPYIPEDDG